MAETITYEADSSVAISYDRQPPMARRVASAILFVGGVAVIFFGLSSALGFSVTGLVASAAAIAALLYAGAVWFGGTSARLPDNKITTPTATTASENRCATVNGPRTRMFTRTNSSKNRNAPASTK